MAARRLIAWATVAWCLAAAPLLLAPPTVSLAGLQPVATSASPAPNHAAVVVDTGTEVKKFCLAFPEESISGAEALRRVDADAVFASFGSRGEAVCALCGTGCPSSNCFCDPKRFWAYHRAGPGGSPYALSRAGASSTSVRDGDVEGWRWGGGEAPPAATVSEVCNVDEPPARTTAGTGGTSTNTTEGPAEDPPATTGPPATPPPAAPATPTTVAPRSEQSGPTTAASDPEAAEPPFGSDAAPEDAAQSEADTRRGTEEEGTEAAPAGGDGGGLDEQPGRDRFGYAAFASLLAAILIWRAYLRRSKVRPAGDQR